MFKVSLLPESYRKFRQGKAAKDIVSKVALLILVCLFIVYAGFMIKDLLVKRQLSKVNAANNELVAQFPALEQYQAIYDNMKKNENIYQQIKPKGISSTEFVSKIINDMPSYVHVKSITLGDWFLAGVCDVECVASSFEDVFDCKDSFAEKDYVSSVVTNEIVKQYNADGTETVTFKLSLATQGILTSDGKAEVVSEETTPAPETDANGETVTTESTSAADTTTTATTTAAAEDTTTTAAEG
ncbi:MAG: hypothetical protein E7515_04780 [Ruminococcaceae bacterium]|nr:hypothetical protein [Oscillospiraceae bacterium]